MLGTASSVDLHVGVVGEIRHFCSVIHTDLELVSGAPCWKAMPVYTPPRRNSCFLSYLCLVNGHFQAEVP